MTDENRELTHRVGMVAIALVSSLGVIISFWMGIWPLSLILGILSTIVIYHEVKFIIPP